MFDIGFWELALIAVIGLIVLGPERLPTVARNLGLWAGRARGYMRSLSSELEREVNTAELRRDMESVREDVESSGRQIKTGGREFESELRGKQDPRKATAKSKKRPASSQAAPAVEDRHSDSDDNDGDQRR